MDVSQFLKSFKRNVAAKAKSGAVTGGTAVTADSRETEELSELIRSDSDNEADEQSSDYVVGGSRADKVSGKRYTAHQKHNQDFDALNVFSTNAQRAAEAGRVQRHRAVVAQQLRDTRKRPNVELVASVRAELLRQRDQLQSARQAVSSDVPAAPVERVAATMVQVEDLLADTAAPSTASTSTAVLLDFLAPPVASLTSVSAAPAAGVGGTVPATAAPDALPIQPSESRDPLSTLAVAAIVASPSPTAAAPSAAAAAAPPAKKRSKFELAVAMAQADEAD